MGHTCDRNRNTSERNRHTCERFKTFKICLTGVREVKNNYVRDLSRAWG